MKKDRGSSRTRQMWWGRREALSGERVAERKQEGELRSENGAGEKRGRKRQKIKRAALDKLVRDALEMKHDDET